METYAHAFFTWALAKHGVKAGRAAGVASAAGAAFPDAPAFAAAVYYWDEFDSMPREELLNAIYFTGPFGAAGTALHSLVVAGALLGLYRALRLTRLDRRRILLWFLLGWVGHTLVDFLTHVDDTRPLLWPIVDWRWSSPVSYYNPLYHGREFMVVEHAAILFIVAGLLGRRLRRRGREKKRDTYEEGSRRGVE